MLVKALPNWFPLLDAACVSISCVLWLFWPELGPLPLLIGLIPWIIRFVISRRLSISTPFDIPLGIFLITAVVAVWTAFDRQTAAEKFWLLIGASLVFYTFANWSVFDNENSARTQAWLLMLLGAATSIYFLLSNDWDAYPPKFDSLKNLGPSIQTLLSVSALPSFHPNVLGAVLAMLGPFAGAAVAIEWRKSRSGGLLLVSLILLTLILFGLFLSIARGAWIALGVGIVLISWWLILKKLLKGRRHRQRNWFFGLPAILLASMMVGLLLLPQDLSKILESFPGTEASQSRLDLYANSLTLLSDNLAFGAGLDSFMMQYSSYVLLSHVGFITHSHSLYLDVVIEQGIVALFALVWMWLLAGEAVWRMLSSRRYRKSYKSVEREKSDKVYRHRARSRNSINQRIMLAAAAVSLVVLLVHGLVDDAIYNSRAVILMFLPLAFTVPQLIKVPMLTRREKMSLGGLAVTAVLIVMLIWWRPILSRLYSNMAAVRQSQGELSLYDWPDYPIQDAVRREVDLVQVIDGYERALELDPKNASANRRLGQIELSLGEYDLALQHLNKAYATVPNDNSTRQLLGEALIMNGYQDEGAEIWLGVNNAQKQLELRQFWYSYLEEKDREQAIHDARPRTPADLGSE